MKKLEGKVAVVTESARGIGATIAERLADLVTFGRPSIANPDLVERFRDRRSACRSRPGNRLRVGTTRPFRLSVGRRAASGERVNSTGGPNAHPSDQ